MQVISAPTCNWLYASDMPAGRPAKTHRCPFGERLYTAREEKGLSQKQVAEKLKITQQSYAAWERRPIAIHPDQLFQLAQILDTSGDFLLGHQNGHKRKGGPVGRVRQVFEKVSRLPRHQQNKVAEFVEAFVAQHGNGHKQAA